MGNNKLETAACPTNTLFVYLLIDGELAGFAKSRYLIDLAYNNKNLIFDSLCLPGSYNKGLVAEAYSKAICSLIEAQKDIKYFGILSLDIHQKSRFAEEFNFVGENMGIKQSQIDLVEEYCI